GRPGSTCFVGWSVVRSPFDLMASADFLVPDRDASVAMVRRVLGFGEPKPRWSWGDPGRGFRVTFCRPNRTLRQSPTLVELIEPAPVDPARPESDVVANVAGLAARQGDRHAQDARRADRVVRGRRPGRASAELGLASLGAAVV